MTKKESYVWRFKDTLLNTSGAREEIVMEIRNYLILIDKDNVAY